MSPKHDTGRWAAHLRGAMFVMVLAALIAGCAPVTTPVPAPVGGTTVAPAGTPSSSATPPAAATGQPGTAVGFAGGLAVQMADNSIQLVDNAGKAMPLYAAAGQVDLSSLFPPGNALSNTLYLPLSGTPGMVVTVNASGGQVLSAIAGPVYGLAASTGGIAFGTADLAANPPTAAIRVSKLDGMQARVVYQETFSAAQRVLRVMGWSADGKRLYFGKEPVGIGGYILFGGLTNLWELDTTTGKVTELIHEPVPNAMVCIDDVSADGSMAADHCNLKTMELIDVAAKKMQAIAAPAGVPEFGQVGGARFSPDGKRLAYGLARHNPDSEQGWVAVADVASGASGVSGSSRLIATSPAHDYFSVVAWADPNTLVLQSSGQKSGVWTVAIDGSNLKRLADGVFLGMLGK